VERPYPLSYSGSASYIWQMTAEHTTWAWLAAAFMALLLIGVAWYVVLCWSLVAELLHGLDRRRQSRLVEWVLRMGTERPWFGFTLGSIAATAVLLVVGAAVQHR
jgi:hypothetical protein